MSPNDAARRRVLVAMSGGVDSAVAAARLRDEGHEVVGVTLHLWDYGEANASGHGRCCAPEDQYDARRTADQLGFPHFSFDRRELFRRTVVDPFVDAYLAGETPSPCAHCNREVKMAVLFDLAAQLGASHVATGHYARVVRDAEGRPFLAKGKDRTKDQSYFLYATPPERLERLVFPLGESQKTEVRAEALRRGLPGASKGESQELCFVEGGSAGAYAAFVEARADGRVRPGKIVDGSGHEIARHDGIHRFTIGQRKGLGVSLGRPAFVTRIEANTATVHLGGPEELVCRTLRVGDVVLREDAPLPKTVRVRVRHGGAEATGSIVPLPEPHQARVELDEDVRAASPGQIAVFYDGDRVVGGGRIEEVGEAASPFSPVERLVRSHP